VDPFGLFDRLADQLRRYQFRIPEWVFAAVGFAAAAGVLAGGIFGSGPLALCAGAVLLTALVGGLRWGRHRRRAHGGLAVARFAAGVGAERREEEVQRIILASLRDKLSVEEAGLVHGIPVVVGADERDFAVALRRRLGARFLLHGRIAEGEGGSHSIYARVAQPIDPGVIHVDLVTRDVTYKRASWRNLINRLTSALDVIDEEYPLEFAKELEAVVRGTAGQLAEDKDDPVRAERLLEDALSVAPGSRSHQIDLLRCSLARAQFDQGREREAIAKLRKRSRDEDAAPELLRTVERLLFLQARGRRSEKSRREGERALRLAVQHRSDPQLALSLYNLAMVTPNESESSAMLDELLASRTHYREAWYVRRQRGAQYWSEAEAMREARGAEGARATYARAAQMYAQAIRRRPHFKLVISGGSVDFFRYRTPPLLYSNAADAYRHAGQSFRARWYAWRGERRRNRWFRRGHRLLKKRRWSSAAELLGHVAMVRGDTMRAVASTWQAVALKQCGDDRGSEELWRATLADDPSALSWRALLVADESYGLGVGDLPGNEPTRMDDVNALIEKLSQSHDRS
jgi:hypothetical protein